MYEIYTDNSDGRCKVILNVRQYVQTIFTKTVEIYGCTF